MAVICLNLSRLRNKKSLARQLPLRQPLELRGGNRDSAPEEIEAYGLPRFSAIPELNFIANLRFKSATESKLASPNVVLGKQTGRLKVKKLRVVPKQLQQKKHEVNTSNLFVFCEKKSGVAQFRASSATDLDCTIERISGLLAIQCLVRGQEPGDFEVMVPAQGAFVERLVSRARELLKE